MSSYPSLQPLRFAEAIDFFRRRTVITDEAWRHLDAEARMRSVWVAGVSRENLLREVLNEIDRALNEGMTFGEFADKLQAKLINEWQGTVRNPAFRVETIYRTNLQTSFNAGRYTQQTSDELVMARPYWQYDALLDNRTTDTCKSLDGTVMPADGTFWSIYYPPNHFNCRSSVITLSERDMRLSGLRVPDRPPRPTTHEGFDAAPSLKIP